MPSAPLDRSSSRARASPSADKPAAVGLLCLPRRTFLFPFHIALWSRHAMTSHAESTPRPTEPVVLDPQDPHQWEISQGVVDQTKRLLRRPILADLDSNTLDLLRFLRRSTSNDPAENDRRDTRYALIQKWRDHLKHHFSTRSRRLKASYAQSSLPVTVEEAWSNWKPQESYSGPCTMQKTRFTYVSFKNSSRTSG